MKGWWDRNENGLWDWRWLEWWWTIKYEFHWNNDDIWKDELIFILKDVCSQCINNVKGEGSPRALPHAQAYRVTFICIYDIWKMYSIYIVQ